jgi:hypothetical protein
MVDTKKQNKGRNLIGNNTTGVDVGRRDFFGRIKNVVLGSQFAVNSQHHPGRTGLVTQLLNPKPKTS